MKKLMIAGLWMASICQAQAEGVNLSLSMPPPPLLFCEANALLLSVTNGSDTPIPIVTSLQNAIQTQIKIDLGFTSQRYKTLRYTHSSSWEQIAKATDKFLLPGQTHVWDWDNPHNLIAYEELMNSMCSLIVTNITINMQIGSNQWVSTTSQSITVLSEKESEDVISQAVQMLETKVHNPFTGKSWSEALHKLTIKEKDYLFTTSGYRVCELPNGETPIIQDNDDGTGFTLLLPTAKQRIRYNRIKMRTEPRENVK